MNNTLNEPGCSSQLNSTAEKVGQTFAYCIILVLSLVGNSSIGIIVYRTQTMRKPINYFVTNMAMSDLLYSIFLFPRNTALLYTERSWLVGGGFGQALCKFSPFLSDTSTIVSVQSLILIAVDRFGAVLFPLRSPLITPRLCPFFILATWVIAMAYHSPYLFVHKLVEYQGKLTCKMLWKETFGDSSSLANYFLAGFIVFIYLPIVLLAMLYSKIFVKLRSQAHPGEQSTNAEEQRTRRNNSVLKMAIAIVLGFVICWVPFTVTLLLQVFAWNRSIPCNAAHYVTFTRFLAYTNCAIKPLICFTFSSNYRQGLKRLIHCFSSAAVLPA